MLFSQTRMRDSVIVLLRSRMVQSFFNSVSTCMHGTFPGIASCLSMHAPWQGLAVHTRDHRRQDTGGPSIVGLKNGLERGLNRRGDVYCMLAAEGRIRRTTLATGPNPAWRQELSFKSVQISSDLQARCWQCKMAFSRRIHVGPKCSKHGTDMASDWDA